MTWEYREEYNKLLEILDQDNRPWRPASLLPNDGTKVFLKCGLDYKGDTLYDVGKYEDYTHRWWYDQTGVDNELEGEWNTEFGNMEEINGWKGVIEK